MIIWECETEKTLENLSAEQAYDFAIPAESLVPSQTNRWHVLMRLPALKAISYLDSYIEDEIVVAYEHQNLHDPEDIPMKIKIRKCKS